MFLSLGGALQQQQTASSVLLVVADALHGHAATQAFQLDACVGDLVHVEVAEVAEHDRRAPSFRQPSKRVAKLKQLDGQQLGVVRLLGEPCCPAVVGPALIDHRGS